MLGSLTGMTAKLFDDFERTNPRPRGHEESVFSFLNRVDQPFWQRIRDELERWYADYPDVQRGFDLRQRFRRPEPAQHLGAWWELYLHRLFRCLGFRVEVEPQVPGGKPDFRVTRDSAWFLMEATTSFSGIVDEERHPKREAAVLAAIDQAQNPNFTVGLEIQQVGDEQPRVPEIVEPLEHWLSSLNPDDESERDIFYARQCPLEVRGWKLLFTAFALRPEARGKPDHRLLGRSRRHRSGAARHGRVFSPSRAGPRTALPAVRRVLERQRQPQRNAGFGRAHWKQPRRGERRADVAAIVAKPLGCSAAYGRSAVPSRRRDRAASRVVRGSCWHSPFDTWAPSGLAWPRQALLEALDNELDEEQNCGRSSRVPCRRTVAAEE